MSKKQSIYITKRDGSKAKYDKKRIKRAIRNAYIEVDGVLSDESKKEIKMLTKQIDIEILHDYAIINVEQIQDLIENKLMYSNRKDVAKAFIIYRDKRNIIRKMNSRDDSIIKLVKGANDELKTENSNKNPVLVATQRDYIAGEACKDLARNEAHGFIPKHILNAHDKGWIHLSDMDYSPVMAMNNCGLINLEDMLQNGTVISGVKIDKPNSFITACTVSTQVITQVASSQYGGSTITLSHLAPFVEVTRKNLKSIFGGKVNDDLIEFMVKREVAAGVQTIQYQLITMSTTNGQSPFVSVFMYLNEIEDKKTRDDLAMIIEEVLKQRILGVKNELGVYITTAFPKLLYVLDDNNITKESEYWNLTQLAAECTAKRLVPDYISAKKMKELKEGNVFPCININLCLIRVIV